MTLLIRLLNLTSLILKICLASIKKFNLKKIKKNEIEIKK